MSKKEKVIPTNLSISILEEEIKREKYKSKYTKILRVDDIDGIELIEE